MPPSSLLVLTASDVDHALSSLSADDLASLMRQVFFSISSVDSGVVAPHRTTVPTAEHAVLFMPACIPPFGAAMKVVSVPTSASDTRGLPASTILLDEHSGAVRAIINASNLTAVRTAAGSLAATHLVLGRDAQPRSIVAFGAGRQIFSHVDLHLKFYPSVVRVTIVNRASNQRLSDLLAELRALHTGVEFTSLTYCSEAGETVSADESALRAAIKDASIIVTATSSTSPLFPAAESAVQPGTHIILVGSYKATMHEISTDLLLRAGGGDLQNVRIVVDSREACATEAGELILAGVGPTGMVEVGELLRVEAGGNGPPIRAPDEGPNLVPDEERCAEVRGAGDVTIFKSVGVGVQDVAIASVVVARATALGFGSRVDGFHG